MRQASIYFDSRFHRTLMATFSQRETLPATGTSCGGMAAKQLLELYRDVPQIPSAGALQHEGKGLPNLVIRRRLCDFKMYEGYESLMMNTELCWFPTVYVFFRTDLKSLDTDISIYISDLSDCFAFQG